MRVRQHELNRLRRGLSGRYVIGPEIGAGGMSTVYRATDVRHDRHVALKLLTDPTGQRVGSRFLREIRITARLQHPHVLPLIDSGSVGHLHFFVTPYIAGQSLGQFLSENGPMPVAAALRLIKEIAAALGYAHDNDIVHLDVKPANILLSGDHAVVADFGIARAVSENCGESLGHGFGAGTPSYMSPEQVSGSQCLDGRSDVYSLACVLFEMLTGEPPFGSESSSAVLSKHLHADVPSVRKRNFRIPRFVDQAIQRAMSKDPSERFPTMAAFAAALRPQPSTRSRRPRLFQPSRRIRLAGASLGIAIMSAFGFGAAKSASMQPANEPSEPRVQAEPVLKGFEGEVHAPEDNVVTPRKEHILPC